MAVGREKEAEVVSKLANMRCLELYSGIGGFCVAANRRGWDVVQAFDINQLAVETYRLNFSHACSVRTIESIDSEELAACDADLWWMSPPCQPFTRRGKQRDVLDPRITSFLHLLDRVGDVQPSMLALENVPEFAASEAASTLRVTLKECGYEIAECQLCPTELGIPNRRRRYYLVASKQRRPKWGIARTEGTKSLSTYLVDVGSRFDVASSLLDDYATAIDCVSATDSAAIATCFTSAYGNSPVRAGSYLKTESSVRRFAPEEILRLLGFPKNYTFPPRLTPRQRWKLVGNSLSVDAVDSVLSSLNA